MSGGDPAAKRARIGEDVPGMPISPAAKRARNGEDVPGIPLSPRGQGMAAAPVTIITGGCGFIGHHVVEHFAKHTPNHIIVIDKLSYASRGFDRLRDSGVMDRVTCWPIDLCNPIEPGMRLLLHPDRVEYIIHMAAETHVDNSIKDPVPFVQNNVNSTLQLLEFARSLPNLKRFVYFSTDEVYGPAEDGVVGFKEWDRHKPSNPYSASKSAAESICYSYYNTFGVPLMSCNVMNAFGERQHPEKYIPLAINKIRRGEKITVHAYPRTGQEATRAGSRFYIHGRNIAAAVLFLLDKGEVGEKYNIRGEKEVDNLEIAQYIAKVLGKELKYDLDDNVQMRPGHDVRYALDGAKMAAMGWRLPLTFEQSLEKMIRWTVDSENDKWLACDEEVYNNPLHYKSSPSAS